MSELANISEAIRANDGARIRGGCDDCDAYQTVTADKWGSGMHAITIHHDDHCPDYQRMSAAS